MESDTEVRKICRSLDQVTMDFFDTLEILYQSQARLEAVMRSGFFSMSRARYSMGGTRNVGALQFAKNEVEMEAVTVVDVSTDYNRIEDKGEEKSWASVEMSLVQNRAGLTKNIDQQKPKHSDDLRQRKGHTESADKVETVGTQKVTKDKEDNHQSKEPYKVQDPLTLFGVLVSPHLRQCQSSFKQAVAITVEIANLKNKLRGLQVKTQELMAQKKAILGVRFGRKWKKKVLEG